MERVLWDFRDHRIDEASQTEKVQCRESLVPLALLLFVSPERRPESYESRAFPKIDFDLLPLQKSERITNAYSGRFFLSAHFNLSRNSAISSILNNFSIKAIMKIILVPRFLV